MYPDGDLAELAARKANLRRVIADRRSECVEAAYAVTRPVAWFERVVAMGRRFTPLVRAATSPSGLGLLASVIPLGKWSRPVRRSIPIVMTAWRLFRGLKKSRGEAESAPH